MKMLMNMANHFIKSQLQLINLIIIIIPPYIWGANLHYQAITVFGQDLLSMLNLDNDLGGLLASSATIATLFLELSTDFLQLAYSSSPSSDSHNTHNIETC